MELRERILEAAAQLYSETGFRGATTRRIAERAGVNEITLFRHFGSKTRLLHEAIQCAGLFSHQCVLPEIPSDVRAELSQWAHQSFRALRDRSSLIRTAMGEAEERPDILPPDRSPTVCAGREIYGYLARLQEAGRIPPVVDVRAAATMLLGTLFADAISRDVIPQLYPTSPEAAVDQYLDLFIRAIGVEEKTA
ncbi:MAG: helix-turn-helix domain-containing protein [Gemmatimonadota bacterium]